MKSKLIHEAPQQTFALVFDKGDEVLENLQAFAREHRLSAAEFTGLGALSDAVLGYFDWQNKDYTRIRVDEQVEVLNLTGNVAHADGEPKLHAHIVLGKADGAACGGHLLEAHVRPTLEVIVTESPRHLERRSDPETGWLCFDFSAAANRPDFPVSAKLHPVGGRASARGDAGRRLDCFVACATRCCAERAPRFPF
jgi:predicted DNA-binding protein with PD1-like motif